MQRNELTAAFVNDELVFFLVKDELDTLQRTAPGHFVANESILQEVFQGPDQYIGFGNAVDETKGNAVDETKEEPWHP
ncbi:hypothetical protein Gogos_008157 [Gossypium gossypioides]|uniref:Uncharacterized protein n=1 Tax=Gossypium gossypioides TaxID=34282 RepID=A0A7J9CAZ8_GOSGO|nr:hypothetical protein [Gossypium gossypioides]